MQELLRAGEASAKGRGGRVLFVDNFLDKGNIEGRFDFSEWVRGYGKYLDESLEVFSATAWHIELEAAGKESKFRTLGPKDLLAQMPYLQRMQRRLVDCVPRGQAARDEVVLHSLGMVVKESFKLYKALSEGVINLADSFFGMEYLDACRGVEEYKEAFGGGEALAMYYSTLQNLHVLKSLEELPVLSRPPADFVQALEAHVKELASTASTSSGGGGTGGTDEQQQEEQEHVGDGHIRKSGSGGGGGAVMHRRTTMPLRKGRLVATGSGSSDHYLQQQQRQSSAIMFHDPGMVMPAGVVLTNPGSNPAPSAEEDVVRVQGEAEEAQVAEQQQEQPSPAIIDLLGFEEEEAQATGGGGGGGQEQAQAQPQPQTQLSALDLLGELDFGAMSLTATMPTPLPQQQQQQYNAVAGPAIPDALVYRAAADMYGAPSSTPIPSTTTAAQPYSATSMHSASTTGHYTPYHTQQQSPLSGMTSPSVFSFTTPYQLQQQQQQQVPFVGFPNTVGTPAAALASGGGSGGGGGGSLMSAAAAGDPFSQLLTTPPPPPYGGSN